MDSIVQLFKELFNLILHMDIPNLTAFVDHWGTLVYVVMFLIIFVETGLVVMPFLPGDSLLFATGAVAGLTGKLNIFVLFGLLAVAAFVGDTVNYWIGHFIGPKAFSGKIRFLKRDYLDRTHAFYEKHGGKTILLARFVPIVRTFAPFVAGVGGMHYDHFIRYNIFGGVLWTALFLFSGYFLGQFDWVERNLHIVLIAIILISLVPAVYEAWKAKREPAPIVTDPTKINFE